MNSKSNNEFNDQDIARVFETHDVEVPEALDQAILRAAKQSGAASKEAETTTAYRRKTWPMHGFAIAATVMLSIAIAPLLIQSPDATPTAIQVDAESSVAAPSMSVTSASVVESQEVVSGGNASADAALAFAESPQEITEISSAKSPQARSEASRTENKQELSKASSAESTQALSQTSIAESTRALSDTSRTVAKSLASSSNATTYNPDIPDSWIDAIKTLARANQIELAQTEFKKFRERYPDFQQDFRLDEFLRSLDGPETNSD